MGVISVVQFKFGFLRSRNNPNSARRTTRERHARITAIVDPIGTANAMHMQIAAKSTEIPDSRSCIASFARRICRVVTGIERRIQSVFPSKETDGAVISFIVDTRQTAAAASIAIVPVLLSKSSNSIERRAAPLMRSRMPAMGMIITPKPQLSIYAGLAVNRLNSRLSKAEKTPLAFCRALRLYFAVTVSEEAVASFKKLFDIT